MYVMHICILSCKEELCVQLAVLFCNNVRRDPSKSDINESFNLPAQESA